MNRFNNLSVVIVALLIAVLSCLCFLTLSGALFIFNVSRSDSPGNEAINSNWAGDPTATPVVVRPSPTAEYTPQVENSQEVNEAPVPITNDPEETRKILSDTIVPVNDVADLAQRLQGKIGIPPTLAPPPVPLEIGSRESFWVTNSDTDQTFQVQAELQYITDHSYFWIEEGVPFDSSELEELAQTFENQIYPTNREFFGSEWTPGVDSDPHLYILYATGLGNRVVGYFSTNDSYNPQVQEYSNGHEMFVLNADSTSLNRPYTYGVLAHEFQHMIHWYRDRNEASWMNEGFSDLAMFLNGYDIGGHDHLFAQDPDLQLTDWPNDPTRTAPHYGASFLFMTYFLDRFGEQATQSLVSDQANGMDSIDNVLHTLGITDTLTSEPITADDVFRDWTVASYLQDAHIADGRFTYHNYPSAPQPSATESIFNCEGQTYTRDVQQYGTDYISIMCDENITLNFEGSTQVGVLPVDPYSGRYSFWSNKGDESDMTLTQLFDFSQHSGPLTLTYWTWYDIEKDWDYLYLEASRDGENWQILTTPSGTGEDPIGANYGWGYTGTSGNGPESQWVQESVDISQFAGEQVYLRFEYITDGAVFGEGLLLDDVAIPEVGYFSDFEDDDGGWQAAGFARIQNLLPQNFQLTVIRKGDGISVENIPTGSGNAIAIPLAFGEEIDEVVLVVSGSTRFTRQPATYRFTLSP